MNFERPDFDAPVEPEKKIISRRNFIKATVGALAAGVVAKKIDFTEEAEKSTDMDPSREPVLVKGRRPETYESGGTESCGEDTFEFEDFDDRESIDWKQFRVLNPHIEYKEILPPLEIENLKLPSEITKYGVTTHEAKILYTLRYENVATAVEDRYNLPPGLLLAMIMEESTGVDLLPNARGDGGFGLCHMQGSTATEYGLKTFGGCNSLVCDGKDSRCCQGARGEKIDHAGQLAAFMKKNADDRDALVRADERLNILLNIDAAGRMIAAGIAGPRLRGALSDLGPLRTAIARYAGAYNYKEYWKDICTNLRDLKDPKLVSRIADDFDRKNTDLKINGEPADFAIYMEKFQEQHANYGLEEYKALPKYLPANTAAVLATYRDFI